MIIFKIPVDDQDLDTEIVCETDNTDNENYGICYESDIKSGVPEITGTVERDGDSRYKIILYIRNTPEDDFVGNFVYDFVRTELDNDQEGDKRDVISHNRDYYEEPIVISENSVREEIFYTASVSNTTRIGHLKNTKGSGEMTWRTAFDLNGTEQCSLDATLPRYADLKGRQNLLITEVRNINDD